MCITTQKFSIMVNGSAYGYIHGRRGIRQGCPLSPYLFVLLMEVFNSIMLKQVASRQFSLHPKCKIHVITHLCFADDLLVFMKGDARSANSLATALTSFSNRTGLVVNHRKSNIFLSSVDDITSYSIKYVPGFEVGTLPMRYLGLPLLSTRLSHQDCIPLVDKVKSRIQSWKARDLAYAGMVLLIQAVLSSMLIFWTSCFVLPRRTINELNNIFRKFLWAGIELIYKQPSVKWTNFFHPMSEGGLGIKCISTTNIAANLRHIWDIMSSKNTIWVRWVQDNLIKAQDFWYLKAPTDSSWCWRRILDHRPIATKFVLHLIGNGDNTKLWKDNWLGHGSLMGMFPPQMQFDSDHHLDARVSSCLVEGTWNLSPNLKNALGNFVTEVESIQTDHLICDMVVWRLATRGNFSSRILTML